MSPALCERHECPDAQALVLALAADTAARLEAAVDARGQALLAVSGGRSPVALFQRLSRLRLPWSRVTVLLVDERCVPPDHADSNAALVQAHLLQHEAATARWCPFFDALAPGEPDAAALAALAGAATRRLHALPWPLDVALLGMGEDGHTASLFPAAPGLDQALSGPATVAWTRPTHAPHARLTLTLPTLLAARALVLPLQGTRKRAVFELACAAPDEALPVSLLLHRAPQPVQVWLAP